MRPSERGLALIRQFEGLRLSAYRCAAGVLTIGYGTTKGVKMGDTITREEADRLLCEDAQRFADHIDAVVKVPLNQNQIDALSSFVYNVGPTAFANSTLLRVLNAGLYKDAADQFLRWNRAANNVVAGLTRRRVAEKALFETPECSA
jgi:lysozyme